MAELLTENRNTWNKKKNSSVSLCSPQILYDGQVAMAKNFIDFRSDLCKQTNYDNFVKQSSKKV